MRQAYDAQSNLETDILLEGLIVENQELRQMLSIAEGTGLQKEENNNNSSSTSNNDNNTNNIINTNNVNVTTNNNMIKIDDDKTLIEKDKS